MSTNTNNPVAKAVRWALLAGLAVTVPNVYAAEEQKEEDKDVERIEVTGSRIKRTDVEGALPVVSIDREQIENSGEVSVADLLRNTTFNSFGSFRPQSGSSAQAVAEISLRGLGGGRTLVLIDGRRAPVSPATGNSQDLNTIPLGAVERIEVLSDGASAVYGSDAIGGVINIITRRDFEGVEATYGFSDPKREGGDTEFGSLLFGSASDKGRMVGGVSFNRRDIIFQRDREWSAGGVSTFSNNFFTARPAAGSLYGFVPGGFLRHPTNGSVVPGGCGGPGFNESGSGATRRCFYDFTFVAADEADTSNTSVFVRGDYQINDDWTAYMSASVSRAESFGRYAPVPSSPWPGGQPFVPVGSPNHPAVRFPNDPFYQSIANQPVFFRHRFAALGNRDTNTDNNVYNALAGFEGTIGEVDVDFGVRKLESKFFEFGRNYVVGGLAQEAISSGRYNIYDPFANDRSVMDSMIATINRESITKTEEVYANVSFDLFELPGGTASMAVGGEYRGDQYSDIYDTLQSSGQIVGSAGNSAGGERQVRAGYVEAMFPVVEDVEIQFAGRYDRYSDYGSDFSPKLAVRWQALENLTLRASRGKGFRAPTLDVVTAQPAFGAATVNHPATCLAFGQPATCQTQITQWTIANPDVGSEQSEQWAAGLAWDATDWLNMTLDWWNIEVTDRVAFIGVDTIVPCLEGTSSNCPSGLSFLPANVSPPQRGLGLGAAFGPQGEIEYVQAGFANLGFIEIDGIDLNVRGKFDFEGAGALESQLQVSQARSYRVDGGGETIDEPSFPKYRAQLQNEWKWGDFAFAWNVSYIHGTTSSAGMEARAGNNDYGYAHRLPSWTTHDLQATWSAPWNGRVTVGVDNIADKEPVIDPFDPTGRGFDFSLYDGYGRVPYVRYTQTF